MRWVKLTLPLPLRPRNPFMTRRLTSSSLAGTLRNDVAVGTVRLRSMLATMAAPAPRIGSPSTAGAGVDGAGAGAGVGAAAAVPSARAGGGGGGDVSGR